jgi:hypothetical protein
MKHAVAVGMAMFCCLSLVGTGPAYAQEVKMKTTPTTKILAIGTINPGVEQAKVFQILPQEVKDTVSLYWKARLTNGTRCRGGQGWRSF